jgi:hypothetical protein
MSTVTIWRVCEQLAPAFFVFWVFFFPSIFFFGTLIKTHHIPITVPSTVISVTTFNRDGVEMLAESSLSAAEVTVPFCLATAGQLTKVEWEEKTNLVHPQGQPNHHQ